MREFHYLDDRIGLVINKLLIRIFNLNFSLQYKKEKL